MSSRTRIAFVLYTYCAIQGVAVPCALGQAKPPSEKPPTPAKPAKPIAFTDVESAGRDFLIQGEYSGYISGVQRTRRVGWQVIALGDGKFRAVEFAGGLPADGRIGPPREFLGDWQAGRVVFPECGTNSATFIGREIWIRDRRYGELLGVLRKVHRESPTLGQRPPPQAIILYDGLPSRGGDSPRDAAAAIPLAEAFDSGRATPDGLLMVGPTTKRTVRDFFLHLEFRTPFMPAARGQGRGNSGVYIQRRYEVQILDSFGLAGVNNECGGLYQQRAPDLNMCLPPLAWQTYDIDFRAARFDAAKKKIAPARITVRHNGVTIHRDLAIAGKTGAGQAEGPEPLPILLQNHGDPVHFRNIWLLER